MSASEMMSFVHLLPMMVGDMIPIGDPVWYFFCKLLEIIDLVLSPEFTAETISRLKSSIEEHHKLYISLFEDTLNPKFHFLLHYPKIIEMSGPPKYFWCFRYEAKHREAKMYAHIITSRKNIPLTLSKKYLLKFAYYVKSTSTLNQIIVHESHKVINIWSHITCSYEFFADDTFSCYTQIRFKDTKYKIGQVLATFDEQVILYELIGIILTKSSNIFFICSKLSLVAYDPHFKSFILDDVNTNVEMNIQSIKIFTAPPIYTSTTASGKKMARSKMSF